MKRFAVLALALGFSSSAAHARRPKPVAAVRAAASRAVVPVVTRDNFVSLSMFSYGGLANSDENIVVRNGSVFRTRPNPAAYHRRAGGFSPPYTPPLEDVGPLSNNQFSALLRTINETRLPSLAGKYQQKGLADGINETVTLTISDEQNRDRTFSIQNYGDSAPRAYYTFMSRLRAFIALKFPEPAIPAQPALSQPASAQ